MCGEDMITGLSRPDGGDFSAEGAGVRDRKVFGDAPKDEVCDAAFLLRLVLFDICWGNKSAWNHGEGIGEGRTEGVDRFVFFFALDAHDLWGEGHVGNGHVPQSDGRYRERA